MIASVTFVCKFTSQPPSIMGIILKFGGNGIAVNLSVASFSSTAVDGGPELLGWQRKSEIVLLLMVFL